MDGPTRVQPLVAMLLIAVVADVLVFPAMGVIDSATDAVAILYGLIIGSWFGQFLLICAFAAMSSQRLLLRQTLALGACMLLLLCTAVSADLADGPQGTIQGALDVARNVPLGLLVAQAPLTMVRLIWGWRIVHRDSRAAPFRLADLFGLTTAVAVALGLMRLPADEFGYVYGGMSYLLLLPAGLNLFVTLPTLIAMLRTNDPWNGLAHLAVYVVSLGFGGLLILASVLPLGVHLETAAAGGAGLIGLFIPSIVVLAIARDRGYELLRSQKSGNHDVREVASASLGAGEEQASSEVPHIAVKRS